MSREISLKDATSRELLKSAGAVFASGIVSSGFSILSNLAAARGLQPAQFGVLAIGLALAAICGRIASFQTWQYIVAKHGQNKAIRRDDDVVEFAVALDFVSCFSAIAIAAALVVPVTALLGLRGNLTVFWILLGAVPPVAMSSHLGVLRSSGRFGAYSLQKSIVSAVKAMSVTACLLLQLPIVYYAAAFVIPDLVGLVGLCRYAGLPAPAVTQVWKRLRREREDWRFVLTTSFHATIKTTLKEIDVLIVAGIVGTVATGYYRIAKQFGAAMHQLSDPLYQVMYPELAERAKAHPEHAARFLLAFTRPMVVVALLMWAALAGSAWLLVPALLGNSYAPAIPTIIVFTAGSAISVAAFGLHPLLVSAGRPAESLRILSVASASYLVVLPLLTVLWGVLGSGAAQIVFYLAWVIMMLQTVNRVIWQRA